MYIISQLYHIPSHKHITISLNKFEIFLKSMLKIKRNIELTFLHP